MNKLPWLFGGTLATGVILVLLFKSAFSPHGPGETAQRADSRSNSDESSISNASVSAVVEPRRVASAPQLTRQTLQFKDVTATAKIKWSYANGASGRYTFLESTGGGAAWFDYDGDGDLDLFAPQGGPVPGAPTSQQTFPKRNALYRNNGDGTFTDAIADSGLDKDIGYGQGASVADYDNDGDPDLYVTAYGGNHLFRNKGGTFEDVTRTAGVADERVVPHLPDEKAWSLSSAWGDYDGDGRLDLFVAHYARWSPTLNKECHGADSTKLSYCRPQIYEGNQSRLYRNNGDGSFSDVSIKSGIAAHSGKSMGAVWLDFDDDGKLDLFVSNDTLPNWLLHNNGNGTFSERAILAGVALGSDGTPMSGMGIGVGDYDADGREDLFVVNYQSQPKSVFRNIGQGLFRNASYDSDIASTNLQLLGFGMEACDYDLDGWKDLIVGNGHVLDHHDAKRTGSSYAQSQQLLHNQRNGKFKDDWRSLGDLTKPRVTRGLATGDYDNDGDPDVITVSHDQPMALFRNDGGNSAHWITLRLEGTGRSPRDAVGAHVTIRTAKGRQVASVRGGSSYLSHSDTRLSFGLGEETQVKSLEVRWPDGTKQKFGPQKPNTFYWLKQGQAPRPDPRIKQK